MSAVYKDMYMLPLIACGSIFVVVLLVRYMRARNDQVLGSGLGYDEYKRAYNKAPLTDENMNNVRIDAGGTAASDNINFYNATRFLEPAKTPDVNVTVPLGTTNRASHYNDNYYGSPMLNQYRQEDVSQYLESTGKIRNDVGQSLQASTERMSFARKQAPIHSAFHI